MTFVAIYVKYIFIVDVSVLEVIASDFHSVFFLLSFHVIVIYLTLF